MGIYIQYILYSLVLIFHLKCGGGGGGNVLLHFMLSHDLPTFLEKNISFSFNVFSVVFLC